MRTSIIIIKYWLGAAPAQHPGGERVHEQLDQPPPAVPGAGLAGAPGRHPRLGRRHRHPHGPQVTTLSAQPALIGFCLSSQDIVLSVCQLLSVCYFQCQA